LRLQGGIPLVLFFLFSGLATGQSADTPTPPIPDKYAFGVIPNNRTVEASLPFEPISARRKLTIGAKDSFAVPIYVNTSLFATIYQLDNENPSFGQGVSGYAKRLGASFADQAIGNMMSEGVMPSILKEDPRYFRRGEGSKKSRTAYALTRIFVTRTDSGGSRFNFSEVLGKLIGGSLLERLLSGYPHGQRKCREAGNAAGHRCIFECP
jgi:hypothetical protein